MTARGPVSLERVVLDVPWWPEVEDNPREWTYACVDDPMATRVIRVIDQSEVASAAPPQVWSCRIGRSPVAGCTPESSDPVHQGSGCGYIDVAPSYESGQEGR